MPRSRAASAEPTTPKAMPGKRKLGPKVLAATGPPSRHCMFDANCGPVRIPYWQTVQLYGAHPTAGSAAVPHHVRRRATEMGV